MIPGDPREDLSPCTILGDRFALVERLGGGGFGAVYRAQETALGETVRTVAVKLTHDRRLSPKEARERLADGFTLSRVIAGCRRAEARKHLIHVYEMGIAGDAGGRAYVVMEYVSGVPLMEHIATFGGSIPMSTARRYFRDLCVVLAACHELDPPITHGDLKADNVLVDKCQTLRLVDFGLARPVDRLAGYAAETGGCLQYTAPETLLGTRYPQSDVYSLGLLMYEVLTGGGPHLHMERPTTVERGGHYYQQKQKLVFEPIEAKNTSLNQDLTLFRIVERCCCFDFRERFASVEEILDALDHGLAARPGGDGSRQSADGRAWQERLEECLEEGRCEDGLRLLESLGASDDPTTQAWRAVLCAHAGRAAEALDAGGGLFESLGTHSGRNVSPLPARLRDRLPLALAKCARDLGDSDLEAYYQSQIGRGAARPATADGRPPMAGGGH